MSILNWKIPRPEIRLFKNKPPQDYGSHRCNNAFIETTVWPVRAWVFFLTLRDLISTLITYIEKLYIEKKSFYKSIATTTQCVYFATETKSKSKII